MEVLKLGGVHCDGREDATAATVGVEFGRHDGRGAANRIVFAEFGFEAVGEAITRRVRGETGGNARRKRHREEPGDGAHGGVDDLIGDEGEEAPGEAFGIIARSSTSLLAEPARQHGDVFVQRDRRSASIAGQKCNKGNRAALIFGRQRRRAENDARQWSAERHGRHTLADRRDRAVNGDRAERLEVGHGGAPRRFRWRGDPRQPIA